MRALYIIFTTLEFIPKILFYGYKITDFITRLGPFFIKLGQMATTRPDLFGTSLVKKLSILQDKVPNIEHNRIPESFTNNKLLASGSIGIVYESTYENNLQVIIKLKRKNIKTTFQKDLDILVFLLKIYPIKLFLNYYLSKGFIGKMDSFLKKFAENFYQHLDFKNEVRNLEFFNKYDSINSATQLIKPTVIKFLENEDIIVMTKIDGVSLSEFNCDNISNKGKRYTDYLLDLLMNKFFDMIFNFKTLHGDLHEGNILIVSLRAMF